MKRVAFLLVLPLVAASVGGCLGTCGHDGIAWTEPGLYTHLRSDGSHGGYAVSSTTPDEAIPIDAAAFEDLWDGPFTLRLVSWTVTREGPPDAIDRRLPESLSLREREGDLRVEGNFYPGTENATVRDRFDEFVSNVTTVDDETRSGWADAFVASRAEGLRIASEDRDETVLYAFNVTIDGADRLAELWDEVASQDAWVEPRLDRPTFRYFEGGAWRFHFHLATKTAEGRDSGGTVTLTVDSGDRAELTYAGGNFIEPRRLDHAGRYEQANRTLTALGFGNATFEDVHFTGVRC